MAFRICLSALALTTVAAGVWRWADSLFSAEEFRMAWALNDHDI